MIEEFKNSLFKGIPAVLSHENYGIVILLSLSKMVTMAIALSHKIERIKPSATLSIANRAAELKAAGQDIIDLSIGEPDFDTPEFIREAAIQAMHRGLTKYTAVDGIPALKQAIVDKFTRENQLVYEKNQVIVSAGAKQCLSNAFTALLNPGDEVIVPAPYWVSYPDMVLLADGLPVTLRTQIDQHFKITPAQLEAAITAKTRVLILNSPSNPSGMVYSKKELKELGQILDRHPKVLVVTDDIYEHILFSTEPFTNIVNACPSLHDRTLVINGVSKAYAMTGLRIGYAAGPAAIIAAMKKVQSQTTSNPCSISQYAALAALTGDQTCVQHMSQEFKRRHDFFCAAINQIPGLACLPCEGAFYCFVHVEKLLQEEGIKTDLELADYFLKEAQVATVPGSAFGTPGYLRISFATDMESLQKAIQRLQTAVTNLQALSCNSHSV